MRRLIFAVMAMACGAFALGGSAVAQSRSDEEAARRAIELFGGIVRDQIERREERRFCKQYPWECRRHREYDTRHHDDCWIDRRGRLRCE